jgi:hypothetical protein
MAEQDPGAGASARSAFDPFGLLDMSQRVALGVASDAFDALVAVGRTAAQPDEAVRQISALVGAIGDLASATAQPMQNFIVQQRELADTMANIARVQTELAGLIESVAVKHAAAVESLESLTAPVFGLVIKADKDTQADKDTRGTKD